MIRVALIVAAVACIACGAQTTSEETRNIVDLMCGTVKVDYKFSRSQVKADGVYGAIVRLYPRSDGSSCCANLPLLAESKTGFSGGFRFKKEDKIPEGRYWLAVELKKANKEYILPVRLMRMGEKETDSLCDSQVFEIQTSGEMILDPVWIID